MLSRRLTLRIATVIVIVSLALCYTPPGRAQPISARGFTVVPLLGGTLIPTGTVTNLMLADVRLTQNGLVDEPLPPFPLVAGKTTMLRGTLASTPGDLQAITAAHLQVIREDTGELVTTVEGYAFAADDRSFVPTASVGTDIHFFVPGDELAEGNYRFAYRLVAGSVTASEVALPSVPFQENAGASMVLVDFDEGIFDSLASVSDPLSLALQFGARMAHTARMLPVKDGAGPLLAGSASPRGASDGVRFAYVSQVPLPALGDLGDIEQEFVLSDLNQGQGANAAGQVCAADVPSLFQPGRFLPTNFTVPEDWNRNGIFDADELDACTIVGNQSALGRRVDNFQSRMFSEIVAQRQLLLASGKEEPAKGLAVLSGGPNMGPGQNRSGWLGRAYQPGSEGWSELLGRPWPAFVQELTHQFGIGHAPSASVPNPAYDLFLRRRVRQPFDVMAGGLDSRSTFANSFLSGADFATAGAGVPQLTRLASSAREPRDSLLIAGSIRGRKVSFSHLRRIERGYPDENPPRADLLVRLLDASGVEVSRSNVSLAPLPYFSEHGGPGRPADVAPFAATVPFDARARTMVLEDPEGALLARTDLSRNSPKVQVSTPVAEGQTVFMSWQGTDADGDRLTYHVSLVDPDGRTISVANDSPATSLRLPRWRIPGSSGVVLRVEASDGFRSATATSGAVSLPNAAPGVAIVTPDDRSALAGPLVHLRALTLDAEDSDLGDLIAWSSSISGTLGRGNSVTARLVAGTHVLTAQVTDRAGASASASIRVTVAH